MGMTSELSNLPGVTVDPRNEAELEAAFGVTSNAEELIKANRGRYTPEQRTALRMDENVGATDSLHELDEDGNRIGLKEDLTDHLGHPVETATVRGKGRRATISYTYVGERGSIEKGLVAYSEVFGAPKAKGSAPAAEAASPREAGQAAADTVLADAEKKAREILGKAETQARELVSGTQERIRELMRDAEQDAQELREKAAQQAPEAAEEAAEEAEGKAEEASPDADAKQAAARGGAKPRTGGGGRSRSSS